MALQLLRADARRPLRASPRMPSLVARRRQRALNNLLRAIRYGLTVPDTQSGRQARLLTDVFGPALMVGGDEPSRPNRVRVLHTLHGDAAAS